LAHSNLNGRVVSAAIFISHSSLDRKVAETICNALESRGLHCWIAYRDVGPGDNFQEAIVKAIRSAQLMLLVFTNNANNSQEIKKEIVLASHHHIAVIPLRVEDVAPNDALAYEFATRQWFDLYKNWDREIERLAAQIRNIVAAAVPDDGAHDGTAARRIPRALLMKRSSSRKLALLLTLVIAAASIYGIYLYARPLILVEARQAIRMADETAWGEASKVGTVEALEQYQEQYPDGAHVTQAQQRIADLKANAKCRTLYPNALAHEPEAFKLSCKQEAIVNDGTCAPGQIRKVIGGCILSGNGGPPRSRSCVSC
jgi:hypothetical protein